MATRLLNAPQALLPASLQVVPMPVAGGNPAPQIQQLYFLREAVARAKKTLDQQRSAAIATFLTVTSPATPDTPLPIGPTVEAYRALVKNETDLKAQSDAMQEIDELAEETLAYFKKEDKEEVIKFLEARIKELRKKAEDLGKPYADLAKDFEAELKQLRNPPAKKVAAKAPAKTAAKAVAPPKRGPKKQAPPQP